MVKRTIGLQPLSAKQKIWRMAAVASNSNLQVESTKGGLLIRLSGNYREEHESLNLKTVSEALDQNPDARFLSFESTDLAGWDSNLVAFIRNCAELCSERNIQFRDDGLPEGMRRLLRLAQAVPEKTDARRAAVQASVLHAIGEGALGRWNQTKLLFTFLGQCLLALVNLVRGRASFRWPDTLYIMQQCGPEAIGIVALINFLVGLILAFVGATQLMRFGASVYVADLVGLATVREMACLMTGIILCGRTGAAFAAQLGTMKVNEEISALETFGVPPIEFLVLPRMIALIAVMPFLCIFAVFVSIFGGFVVSISMLHVSPTEYLLRTMHAIDLKSFLLGIGKGTFFGFIVAYAGCLRGLQAGYSAAAVGEATTMAVVTGITAIIASDGVFAVICHALGI
jgi:phospholipid/cholesterol/gamma-HCH transport system permease protein